MIGLSIHALTGEATTLRPLRGLVDGDAIFFHGLTDEARTWRPLRGLVDGDVFLFPRADGRGYNMAPCGLPTLWY